MTPPPDVIVRQMTPTDFDAITRLTMRVYPGTPPWNSNQLASHRAMFPEGQLVAEDSATGQVVGMASSLIILWDDYEDEMSWRDFTAGGMFTNHDPVNGRTLYGAEIMVDPDLQGRGIGKKLYEARRELAMRLGLLRIRAGARLRGYSAAADRLTPEAYVRKVVASEMSDATLTFQLRQGFHVIGVVSGYLKYDPESRGYAAIIEWLNPEVAKPEHWAARPKRFLPPEGVRAEA
jgi:GNAT superfamily N-acetyltransferase